MAGWATGAVTAEWASLDSLTGDDPLSGVIRNTGPGQIEIVAAFGTPVPADPPADGGRVTLQAHQALAVEWSSTWGPRYWVRRAAAAVPATVVITAA